MYLYQISYEYIHIYMHKAKCILCHHDIMCIVSSSNARVQLHKWKSKFRLRNLMKFSSNCNSSATDTNIRNLWVKFYPLLVIHEPSSLQWRELQVARQYQNVAIKYRFLCLTQMEFSIEHYFFFPFFILLHFSVLFFAAEMVNGNECCTQMPQLWMDANKM